MIVVVAVEVGEGSAGPVDVSAALIASCLRCCCWVCDDGVFERRMG